MMAELHKICDIVSRSRTEEPSDELAAVWNSNGGEETKEDNKQSSVKNQKREKEWI